MSISAKNSPSPTTAPSSNNAAPNPAWRDAFVDACAILASAVVAITEILSRLHALTRIGVFVAWTIVALCLGGWFVYRRVTPAPFSRARMPKASREEAWYIAFVSFISLVTLYVALAGQPNIHDALSYHLPRVMRWAQDGAVTFYPTHIPRQLWIGPGWEYFAVHLKLLTGTDALASTVQWLALIASPVVVSLISRELGAGRRGQLIAALFTFTIPMGIAQASGAQVDLFSGFWLATSLALLLRIKRQGVERAGVGDATLFGIAAGMALFSKATNVLFLLPFVVAVGATLLKKRPARFAGLAGIALVMTLAMNAGHLARNTALYGGPLGPANSSGVVNATFGPRTLASNILRNAVLHLNTTSDQFNAAMTRAIARVHSSAGIDVNDPRTTYSESLFEVPPEWDDEAIASNQLHFLLIVAVTAWVTLAYRTIPPTRYLWCILAGALLFCVVLKWQPWHSRLHLPLFMIAGAGIGASLERALTWKRLRWVAVALALTALHPTFRNSLRPLLVRRPLFTRPYEERLLFPDHRKFWKVYDAATKEIASRNCTRIGIIEDTFTWEYPIWKLIERRSGIPPEIRHVGVTNVSRVTASERDRTFRPCAIMTVHYFVPDGDKNKSMQRNFPEGTPEIPSGFAPAWQQEFITIYLPASSARR